MLRPFDIAPPCKMNVIALIAIICFGLTCWGGVAVAATKSTPRLYMSYVFTTHHTPLMVAAEKGEDFKPSGAYLKEMVPRQKYELIGKNGQSLAVVSLIVSKSGSETAVLFAQDRLDLGLASSTAFMSGIDRGTPMKILAPLHVDGLSMVFPADSKVKGYADVEQIIKMSDKPFKIGYHSPTSAPRVVFEGALQAAGMTVTGNPNNLDADILLVDLKSTANLIPALMSKQVDCWVGPAPHPAVAEHKHVGHVGLDSRDLPPKGEWEDFPCCVLGASDKLIAENPEVVQAMTDLLVNVTGWCNQHKTDTAKISSAWIGVPEEAVAKSSIIYTTIPSQKWLNGEGMFLTMLQGMGKFKGLLKDVDLESAKPILFDFSFVERSAQIAKP